MTTLSGKIAVMQHFLNGGKVEYTSIGQNCWADYVEPSWNWALFDYRIKEEPKEYEIQTVIQPHVESKYTLYKNVQFGSCYNGDVYCCNGGRIRGFDMMENISKYNWKINSVKRLSDNEIFTIGDRVKQSNVIHDNSFTITGFKLDVNNKHLLVLGNGGIRLSKIEKIKAPKYVPFTFDDDLLGLKVKYKSTKEKMFITYQSEDEIQCGGLNYSYDNLLEDFEFINGTPCGKLETI